MDYLRIKRSTLRELNELCSTNLLTMVFDDFGRERITIDENNLVEDKWDLTQFLDSNNIPLVEKLKVILCLETLFCTLIYQNHQTDYTKISLLLRNHISDKVLLYWMHTEMNGCKPYFGIGDFVVPPLLPQYAIIEMENSHWGIEKLVNGEYVCINGEVYNNEEEARQRVEILNNVE